MIASKDCIKFRTQHSWARYSQKIATTKQLPHKSSQNCRVRSAEFGGRRIWDIGPSQGPHLVIVLVHLTSTLCCSNSHLRQRHCCRHKGQRQYYTTYWNCAQTCLEWHENTKCFLRSLYLFFNDFNSQNCSIMIEIQEKDTKLGCVADRETCSSDKFKLVCLKDFLPSGGCTIQERLQSFDISTCNTCLCFPEALDAVSRRTVAVKILQTNIRIFNPTHCENIKSHQITSFDSLLSTNTSEVWFWNTLYIKRWEVCLWMYSAIRRAWIVCRVSILWECACSLSIHAIPMD